MFSQETYTQSQKFLLVSGNSNAEYHDADFYPKPYCYNREIPVCCSGTKDQTIRMELGTRQR